ncbi:MAG: ABC transporter permease [Acidimicrobiaceae bacterium]|nr:ABC transporter permease [Acidimicrobiaceae bacterium]
MLLEKTSSFPDKDAVRSRIEDLPIRVVSPKIGVFTRLQNIWVFRELLVSMVRKELRIKYKNSVLGFMWSLLNPALYLVIYYIVFQKILKNNMPLFAIFLLCGLLVWNFFSNALSSATTTVVNNAGIVKKVAFPREILALASVGAALIFFLLQACVLILALMVFQVVPAFGYLWLVPFALLALVFFASALAIALSAINVYLRDTQHLMELVLLAWFWGTPIVYPFQEIGVRLAQKHLIFLYFLNPVTVIVLTFQRALYAKMSYLDTSGKVTLLLPTYSPEWFVIQLLIVICVSAVLFIGALMLFGRLEGNFAEEL